MILIHYPRNHGPLVLRLGLRSSLIAWTITGSGFAQPGPVGAPSSQDPSSGSAGAPAPVAPANPEQEASATAAAPDSTPSTEAPGGARSVTDEDYQKLLSRVAELEAKQAAEEEREVQSLSADTDEDLGLEKFRVYGFMDAGFHRYFSDDQAIVGLYLDTNASTFVLGNINLYFDFQPDPDWRALTEVRFTTAPHGVVEHFGGLGGEFERTSTFQFDPHSPAGNAPMWWGSTVIERAHIEWTRHQALNLLVGYFNTPFGIWNVDHGQPTLISLAMPQFIQQRWIPLRQTGVQALGSFFLDDWELAYRAWISNGRTEDGPLDFDDDKGFGGRVMLRQEKPDLTLQFAGSYQFDHVRDKVLSLDSLDPFRYSADSTWEYDEHIAGIDASLDYKGFRARSEASLRYVRWYEGKRAATPVPFGAFEPDKYAAAGYLLLSQRLPFAGLEPWAYAEVLRNPWVVSDGVFTWSAGVNVHFTPHVTLKTSVGNATFFNWDYQTENPGRNDVASMITRLVAAF